MKDIFILPLSFMVHAVLPLSSPYYRSQQTKKVKVILPERLKWKPLGTGPLLRRDLGGFAIHWKTSINNWMWVMRWSYGSATYTYTVNHQKSLCPLIHYSLHRQCFSVWNVKKAASALVAAFVFTFVEENFDRFHFMVLYFPFNADWFHPWRVHLTSGEYRGMV